MNCWVSTNYLPASVLSFPDHQLVRIFDESRQCTARNLCLYHSLKPLPPTSPLLLDSAALVKLLRTASSTRPSWLGISTAPAMYPSRRTNQHKCPVKFHWQLRRRQSASGPLERREAFKKVKQSHRRQIFLLGRRAEGVQPFVKGHGWRLVAWS